jgi:hypothetical protein
MEELDTHISYKVREIRDAFQDHLGNYPATNNESP